jgi:hypothetical protein
LGKLEIVIPDTFDYFELVKRRWDVFVEATEVHATILVSFTNMWLVNGSENNPWCKIYNLSREVGHDGHVRWFRLRLHPAGSPRQCEEEWHLITWNYGKEQVNNMLERWYRDWLAHKVVLA